MSPADRLSESLDDLRQAARRGDFAAFDSLAGRLAQDVAALEATPPDPPTLQRLISTAADLTVLLQAAGQGLAAARRRLAEIETVRRGLGTYGGNGQRRHLATPSGATRRL